MKMQDVLSNTNTYTWYLKNDYTKMYSVEINMADHHLWHYRGKLVSYLLEHREKAIEHLLWSSLYVNNASQAAP